MPRAQQGLTLIEMVLVVVLLGILGTIGVQVLIQTFKAQDDIARRAQLVDEADLLLTLMVRDIRRAVPNSLRVLEFDGDPALSGIELVPSLAGGRYRARSPNPDDPDDPDDPPPILDILDIAAADDRFEVLSHLELNDTGAIRWLVVYNTSADLLYDAASTRAAWQSADGWTPATRMLRFNAHQFPRHSPSQRFHLASDPIAYVCDSAQGTLTRYSDYGFRATPPADLDDFDAGTSTLLATRIGAPCVFLHEAGSDTRHGLARLTITLERDGERVWLSQQVPVLNSP